MIWPNSPAGTDSNFFTTQPIGGVTVFTALMFLTLLTIDLAVVFFTLGVACGYRRRWAERAMAPTY